jgi:hypothetical protein
VPSPVLKEPTLGTLAAGCAEVVSGAAKSKAATTALSEMSFGLTAMPLPYSVRQLAEN